MKTIVVTIMDDICTKNGRDPEATALIEAAKSFGKVESLDAVLAQERAKYEGVIANLRAQNEANSEHCITPAELDVLRVIRKKSADESTAYESTIAERDALIKEIRLEAENRASQIKAIYGF